MEREESAGDADVWVVFALFWLVSLARIVLAFVRGETFGTEATLAVLAVIGVPLALRGRPRASYKEGIKKHASRPRAEHERTGQD